MQGEFRRGGLRWQLDLNEGIDFAIWLTGGFERRLQATYSRLIRPGMTVLDLGANIGAHTLPLARLVGPSGKVVAVEATAYAINKLRTNLSLNRELEPPVRLVHALLVADTSEPAPSHLYSSWPLTQTAELHPVLCGALKSLDNAIVTTVDAVVREHVPNRVDWIKLDVDGHELAVLQGAAKTLAKDRPGMFLEFAPYCHAEEPGRFARLVQLLLDANYDLQVAETQTPLPASIEELENLIPRDGSINVLALPKEAADARSTRSVKR
jgi:FkbM family methyltransferase